MNKIPNRQAICEVLMKHAETDKDIVVSRIWSAFLPVLQNAARKHLRHLRRASFLQEAMSRQRLTVHTPTPM